MSKSDELLGTLSSGSCAGAVFAFLSDAGEAEPVAGFEEDGFEEDEDEEDDDDGGVARNRTEAGAKAVRTSVEARGVTEVRATAPRACLAATLKTMMDACRCTARSKG